MRLRQVFQLMEAAMLAEATKYDPMFAEMLRLFPNYKGEIESTINWARQKLGREDRIVWFLRWYRVILFSQAVFQTSNTETEFTNTIRKVYQKYLSQLVAEQQPSALLQHQLSNMNVQRLKSAIEHVVSLPVPSIQNYVFDKQTPEALLRDLNGLEEQWKVDRERKSQHIEPQNGDEVLIDFGDGWAWWLLGRGSCDLEAKAMGHCGNVPSEREGDRILSLRKQGTDGWRPSLTFILNGDGKLGEMKGRGNDKPAPQYHPYIVKLLENPIIQGIRGGGYEPKNNFRVTDLSPEEQVRLFEVKPQLASGSYLLQKFGPTDEFGAKIMDEMNEVLDGHQYAPFWDSERKIFIVEQFKTVDDLVAKHGSDMLKNVANSLNGGDDFYDYDYPVDNGQAKEIYDSLETEIIEQIARYAQANYGGDEDYEDWDWSDPNEVWDILVDNDDGVVDAMKNAVKTGFQRGAESDMYESFVKALHDPFSGTNADYLDVTYTMWTDEKGKDHIQMDGACAISISPKTAAHLVDEDGVLEEIADEGWALDQEIPLDEPHYGWSGYDEEAAQSEAVDRLEWDAPEVSNH